MAKTVITEKGVYAHPVPHDFIEIKQYMFGECDGERSLFLRCYNTMEYPLEEFRYIIAEYDKNGALIVEREYTYRGENMAPKRMFTLREPMPLSHDCFDFEVRPTVGVSGDYHYVVEGDRVVVRYVKQAPKKRMETSAAKERSRVIRPYRRVPASIGVLAPMIFVLGLGLLTFVLFSNYTKDMEGVPFWREWLATIGRSIGNFFHR